MILLAIESATTEVGVAVIGPTGLLAEATERPGRFHVERLHPLIQSVLTEAGCVVGDLEGVIVDVGPGRFTGLRVGMAAAMGLALGAGIGIVTVTSTEVLRAAVGVTGELVVPVVDLRRGGVAFEDAERDGELRVSPPEELAVELKALGSVLLVGDGALAYRELFEAGGARVAEGPLTPPVGVLATIGRERAIAGALEPPASIEARYLRDADAIANFPVRPGLTATSQETG